MARSNPDMTPEEARRNRAMAWTTLAVLIGFFGMTFLVNGIFISQAMRTFPGEDVKKSYLQGLEFNQTLARRKAQAEAGWVADVKETYVAGAGALRLEVTVRRPDGGVVEGLVLSGELRRPVAEGFDHSLEFSSLGEGRYAADLADVAQGNWTLRLVADETSAAPFEAERTIVLQ